MTTKPRKDKLEMTAIDYEELDRKAREFAECNRKIQDAARRFSIEEVGAIMSCMAKAGLGAKEALELADALTQLK